MFLLAPSILSADFAHLKKQVDQVVDAGCDYIHIDVMDGHFVPNISIGPLIVKALRPHYTNVFDVHLMIENPEHYIDEFAKSGADLLVVHQEACIHLDRVLHQIKDQGVKAGVSINPATPIQSIEHVLPLVDMVLLMSVNPGFGGQSFIPYVYDKIEALARLKEEKNMSFDIEVDGGISVSNVKQVVDKGANVIVAGSAIFNQPDIKQAVADFRKAVSND